MLPQRVIYSGVLYDTLGLIKLNKGSFVIIKNNDNILSLDLSKTGLNLNLKFEVKEATKAENVLIGYILGALKNTDKKELYVLRDYMNDINKYVNTHPELLKNISSLENKDDMVMANITNLIQYFEDAMNKMPDLDFSSVTSFKVEDKDYIKYKDENNNIKILEDTLDNRNFIEQLKQRQSESKSFQTDDSLENVENMIENMEKFEKESIELETVEEEKKDAIRNASGQQYISASVMEHYADKENEEIVGNVEAGIYYNKDDDQILTTKEEEGKVVIKGVEETKADGASLEYPAYDEALVDEFLVSMKGNNEFNLNDFINNYLNQLSSNQIDYIFENYVLNEQQTQKLKEQKDLISREVSASSKGVERPKIKSFTLYGKDIDNAAFIDAFLLVLIIGSLSGIYLTYLIFGIMS